MDPSATLASLHAFSHEANATGGGDLYSSNGGSSSISSSNFLTNATQQLATLATSILTNSSSGIHHYQIDTDPIDQLQQPWSSLSSNSFNDSSSSSSSSEELPGFLAGATTTVAAAATALFANLTGAAAAAAATIATTTAATLPPLTNVTTNHLASTITSTLLAAASAAASADQFPGDNDGYHLHQHHLVTTISSAPLSAIGATSSSAASSSSDEAIVSASTTLGTLSRIIICIVLTAVILGTIVGNILVCIAVCLVKKLRRPCNYLLVSLALSDLAVAVLVMPVALINELGDEWPFGNLFCDIWVSFDVLSCTASILNLCAISVDRYWAITKPLEYGVKRTPRRMLLCVALVWLGSACISLPPLLILGNEHYKPDTTEPWCQVSVNFYYQIYATTCAFYLPLIIMLFVYYQIFRAARRIVLDEKRAQTRLDQAMMINGHHPQSQQQQQQNNNLQSKDLKVPGNNNGSGGSTALIAQGNASPHQHQRRLRFQLAKERKASTTLGIIMSSFTLCWLPFFILAVVRPFLDKDHQVPDYLSSIFLWLGYANSLLNPIIYATLNRDFRKPFQEILFFRCSNLNTIMREEYYHSQYGEPASQRVVVGGEGHGARESFL